MVGPLLLLKVLHCKRKHVKNRYENVYEGPSKERKLENKIEASDDLTCRICLKRGKLPIFLGSSTEELCESIFTIGGIEVSADDPYPKFLCHSCDALLRGAILFRKTAKLSDDLLKKRKAVERSEITLEIDDHSDVDNDEDISVNNAASLQKVKCSKPRCDLEFSTFQEYSDHLLSAEHENKKYPCKTAKLFDDLPKKRKAEEKSELTLEIDDHSDVDNDEDFSVNTAASLQKVKCSKPRVCKRCDLEFSTFQEYSDHLLSAEHENKKYPCNICNNSYTPEYYKRHLCLRKPATTDICDVCGKKFTVKSLFSRHRLTHFYDLPYQCSHCPYRGRFSESLRMHMRTHTGDKPYQCEECPSRFINKSNLNRHMLVHRGEHDFRCEICGRGFYYKRELDLHIKVDHTGIREHVCRTCGKAFGYRKQMMKHELKVHKREKLKSGRMPIYLQVEKMKQSVVTTGT